MTYHAYSKWKPEDGYDKKVVEEVVSGLEANRIYNDGKCYTPDAYGLFCPVDAIIFYLGRCLDRCEEEKKPLLKEVEKCFGKGFEIERKIAVEAAERISKGVTK